MVDNRSHNQLREERDKQQIVDNIVLLRFASVRIHQECDQLERKEGNTDGKYNMLQTVIAAGQQIVVLDKEIGVFVVSQKADITGQADEKQQLFLDGLVSLHSGHGTSDDVVSYDTAQKEGEEIGAALTIEVQGAYHQPDFGHRIILKFIQNKINKKGNRQKQKDKLIG